MSLDELLAAIEALLREERSAVAAFDVPALTRITALKGELGEKLRAIGPRPPSARAAVARVAAQAQANAALLAASTAAISDALGIRAVPATYDSRARLRRSVNVAPVRVI